MYLPYYHLKRKPFQIDADPRFLWLGEKHKEALATLKYGIKSNKGFLLLTGDVGTGKTTLINALLSSLDDKVIVASIPDPGLSKMEFFRYVGHAFGIKAEINNKVDFLLHFGVFLEQQRESGHQLLLIIDEAQRLDHELLEEIRLLSNIETRNTKLLNIFFIGQNEFNDILQDPRNKALRQRITVNFHIDALSEGEVEDYVRHRLLIAGSRKPLFASDAIRQVYLFSHGYPRLINVICDRALLTGYVEDLKLIRAKTVRECAGELALPGPLVRNHGRRWSFFSPGGRKALPTAGDGRQPLLWPVFLGIPVLLVTGAVAYFGYNGEKGDEVREQIEEIIREAAAGIPQGEEDGWTPEPATAALPEPGEAAMAEPGVAESGVPAPALRVEAAGAMDRDQEGPDEAAGLEGPGSGEPAGGQATASSPAGEEPPPEEPRSSEVQEGSIPPGRTLLPMRKKAVAQEGSALRRASQPGASPDGLMIHFDLDSNDLPDAAYQRLDRFATQVQGRKDIRIMVTGYTDTSGFYHYNRKISESRANMVKGYLIGRGIDPRRIQTEGKGPENPLATNETPEGRSMNRRVEIELVEGG